MLKMKFFFIWSLLLMLYSVNSVDRTKFKTCEEAAFCSRCRSFHPTKSEFALITDSIDIQEEFVRGSLVNTETNVRYSFLLEPLVDNTVRLRVNEEYVKRPRFQPVQALVAEPVHSRFQVEHQDSQVIVLKMDDNKIYMHANPFKIDLYYDDELVISANAQGRFLFEHQREKPIKEESADGNETTSDNIWEERYHEHIDSRPFGPTAVAMDFLFPSSSHVYGIPSHADNFSLRSTSGSSPYRLYNLDVFEYEINERMSLYGAVPFLMAHGINVTSGLFWLNSAETWIDISKATDDASLVQSFVNYVWKSNSEGVSAYFMSEAGIVDVFLMSGPSFYDVTRQYSRLTGAAPLPQYFALGYHQSRWNYKNEKDVNDVLSKFDEDDIPVDAIWLDIEYTDGKKYFTWDPEHFPNPEGMIKNITEKGRKLITIIDPHIKRDSNYFLHKEATEKGYYVKTKEKTDFEGWCWPGASSYLDFLNPDAGEYYSNLYRTENFKGSSEDVHIWNDMNEPSVFSGPEVTMPKDCLHHGGWEHREIHNIYGFLQTMYTYQGLIQRSDGRKRPFILTRAHFAGTQRYAAIWTGDNMAEWSHLRASVPMCLSSAVAGISFCGADVGGFFRDPDSELLVRWYQIGSYLPFFRAHAHIDTRRREPWLYGEDTEQRIRLAVYERYALLPYWYTVFYEHEKTGAPVIRPLFAEFLEEKPVFDIDYEFLLGDAVLVRPVTEHDVQNVNVYFPGVNETWYDKDTFEQITENKEVMVHVTLNKIPVYYRGGSIIPMHYRMRRCSMRTLNDPYTLIVLLDINGTATGHLFIDDGESFDYRRDSFSHMQYSFVNNQLISSFIGKGRYESDAQIERVIIAGIPNIFKKGIIRKQDGSQSELGVVYNVQNKTLVVRKPLVNAASEWSLSLL